jgi:hypothetical protein
MNGAVYSIPTVSPRAATLVEGTVPLRKRTGWGVAQRTQPRRGSARLLAVAVL